MKKLTSEQVKALLNSPQQVVIVPHVNPDGDASFWGMFNGFLSGVFPTFIRIGQHFDNFEYSHK